MPMSRKAADVLRERAKLFRSAAEMRIHGLPEDQEATNIQRFLEAADACEAGAAALDLQPQLVEALKLAERFCPCGARPDSLNTHPHVGGCLIGDALFVLTSLSTGGQA